MTGERIPCAGSGQPARAYTMLRDRCSWCGRMQRVNKDGLIGRHYLQREG